MDALLGQAGKLTVLDEGAGEVVDPDALPKFVELLEGGWGHTISPHAVGVHTQCDLPA